MGSGRHWELEAMRWQPTTMNYRELMFLLSHCDDCWCRHDNPIRGCRCVCHGEEDDDNRPA